MTYSTPSSTSISALISPVKAPFAAQCTFSAPTLMLVPAVASTAAARSVYGVQMTTSHAGVFQRDKIRHKRLCLRDGVVHLPVAAMIGLRIISPFLSCSLCCGAVCAAVFRSCPNVMQTALSHGIIAQTGVYRTKHTVYPLFCAVDPAAALCGDISAFRPEIRRPPRLFRGGGNAKSARRRADFDHVSLSCR